MFKLNDKIRLKSHVCTLMLDKIGLPSNKVLKKEGVFIRYYESGTYARSMGEKGKDVVVKFSTSVGNYYLPEAWVELAAPKGHHLTNIFK